MSAAPADWERGATDEAAPQGAAVPYGLDEYALAELRYGWGDAYRIWLDGRGGWRASRRDGKGGDITAATADVLWDAVRADYRADPVPRVPAVPGGDGA